MTFIKCKSYREEQKDDYRNQKPQLPSTAQTPETCKACTKKMVRIHHNHCKRSLMTSMTEQTNFGAKFSVKYFNQLCNILTQSI